MGLGIDWFALLVSNGPKKYQVFYEQLIPVPPYQADSRTNGHSQHSSMSNRCDLSSVPCSDNDEHCSILFPLPQPAEAYMWANSIVENGVPGERQCSSSGGRPKSRSGCSIDSL